MFVCGVGLVIICNLNNLLGMVFIEVELCVIVDIVVCYGVWVIVDEIWVLVVYGLCDVVVVLVLEVVVEVVVMLVLVFKGWNLLGLMCV